MKLLLVLSIALSLLGQSCADSNFLDRARKDQSVLQGTEVTPDHTFAKSIVMITQEMSMEDNKPMFFGLCTGLILSPRVVLTAAHCLDHGTKKMKVILNPKPRESLSEASDVYDVIMSELHPTYKFKKIYEHAHEIKLQTEHKVDYKDVALLVVDRDFPVNMNTPATTLEKIDNLNPERAVVAGFGKTTPLKDTGSMDYKTVNGVLKRADISLSKDSYGENGHIILSQKQRSGVCKGDSGAPLFVKEDGHYKLLAIAIGVFSSTTDVGRLLPTPAYYDECAGFGVYQSIDSVADWILTTRFDLEKIAQIYQKSILFKNDSLEIK